MDIFALQDEGQDKVARLDSRLQPTQLLFVVYLLGEELEKITLTTEQPLAKYQEYTLSVINGKLFMNGDQLEAGYQQVAGQDFLVLSSIHTQTTFFCYDERKPFVISSDEQADLKVRKRTNVVMKDGQVLVHSLGSFMYLNSKRLEADSAYDIAMGSVLLTDEFVLERRKEQWWLTCLSEEVQLSSHAVLLQDIKEEFPKDFPDYRRKPRLNLEVPTNSFKLEGFPAATTSKKQSLLKTILPPLGMLSVTALTSVVSGGNPMMMMSMGMMSLMTVSFSVSQYVTDKKEEKEALETQKSDYKRYLVNAVSEIENAYQDEQEILHYRHIHPAHLVDMIEHYDSRIYERQRTNKDFLEVSIGLSQQQTNLKIDSAVDEKDFTEKAKHIRSLVQHYTLQRDVPTPLSLVDQSLGIVARDSVATSELESILLQMAFFHSYQDVNFIHLVSRKDYLDTWRKWRFLPHFQLRELNLRGIVYNQQLKEVVLNSFYQLLVKRKQALAEAGRELPIFSPHYVLTIFDDELLAGHGINELLAENMNELGVTVIWVKENSHYMPETVTSLIELSDANKGRLLTNNNVFVNCEFTPYPTIPTVEGAVRMLANLNHLEVEKNAVPEKLSLLEQYEVKRVEELDIRERWSKAEPNKSIRSLIGWRGKGDYVFWDLHERAHGPHALVGGTTGSGKSEFLTTYLMGLAINFSPEDIGMLIIDWKGGGIANTLDKLPHFMGAITNLDGAGTARALASIKAELDKRQREFAKYGVNNINGYMNLYKHRHEAKPDVHYPDKPLPHLILVSDEFAELKANVPEFLDELTSVARIGRSLGVHLILATQKPSGVVNDQIEANSHSKIALKMASPQDSNELLKTPDAAHITNPGRGYLKVGQNEVYDLFQSGYAGVTYDPDQIAVEQVDERIFKINDLGQYELLYDPDEDVVQGQDTSDLPTQLEAVIEEINQIFASSTLVKPEKPWLPNLAEAIGTPVKTPSPERNLSIPLGLVDKPSEQAQINFDFDLLEASHTAIFGSPGYGKTTVLQTMVMNLARVNTPEQLHVYLVDFGNNGLLPLKELPHVADIVSLEENEKLNKVLSRLSDTLSERKKQFKDIGVANLSQFERKSGRFLPIIAVVLDNYDSLTPNDTRKEKIDETILQLLRDGASLGVYLIMTANRVGAVRMNMMSTLSTKLALYLNDESELSSIMGRDRVMQQSLNGRGQVMLDVPVAIQYYLPVAVDSSTDVLAVLEEEVSKCNQAWTGQRPESIPMVPERLSMTEFEAWPHQVQEYDFRLGLDKQGAEVEGFTFFQGKMIGIFTESLKQTQLLLPRLVRSVSQLPYELLLIDMVGNLRDLSSLGTIYLNRTDIQDKKEDLRKALFAAQNHHQQRVILINGLAEFTEKMLWNADEIQDFLAYEGTSCQFIVLDQMAKVGAGYGGLTTTVKEMVADIVFGGDYQQQRFVEQLTMEQKRIIFPRNIVHRWSDERLVDIVLPEEIDINE